MGCFGHHEELLDGEVTGGIATLTSPRWEQGLAMPNNSLCHQVLYGDPGSMLTIVSWA